MYTIAFLKVRVFQLSNRHISTYKITRMVALSVSITLFNVVYEGKYCSCEKGNFSDMKLFEIKSEI